MLDSPTGNIKSRLSQWEFYTRLKGFGRGTGKRLLSLIHGYVSYFIYASS